MESREFEGFYSDVVGKLPPLTVNQNTALVLIDLQRGAAHRESSFGSAASSAGHGDSVSYFFTRVEDVVSQSVTSLLAAFRRVGLPVLHMRVAQHTTGGVETSWRYKEFGIDMPGDSEAAEFLDWALPIKGELVLDKNTSSAFMSTPLDFYLRNMGVTRMVVVGVVTNNCVESTVRSGADLGYGIILPEDGCAAWSEAGHEASLRHLHRNFAHVTTTPAVLKEVDELGG